MKGRGGEHDVVAFHLTGEIARVTDVGVETAKSRLRYAIRKLKKSLAARIPAASPLRTGRDLKDTLINGSA